jgi:hypothetical protein
MTATLLTVAQLHEHVETDLPDAALQRILDAEEAEIILRHGAHATASEMLPGGGEWLVLTRAAASITSITETVDDVSTVLAADDYLAWDGSRLQRLDTGTNARSCWGERVTAVYIPLSQVAQRTLVLIQLCKLAIVYNGLKTESVGQGDHSETAMDYNAERAALLRSLSPRGFVFA